MSPFTYGGGSRNGAQLPKKHSPSDMRRRARRMNERIAQLRGERHEAWLEGGRDPFLADRQESGLDRLHGEKRELRREVYDLAPDLEGRPVFRGVPRTAR